MESLPKRSRLDLQPSGPSTSFSLMNNFTKEVIQDSEIFRLNDDCFEAIFCWLSAEDLPAVSDTCVRIQNLVKIYFVRQHAVKRTEIQRINGIVTVKKYGSLSDVIPNVAFCGNQKLPKSWDSQNRLYRVNDLLYYYMQSKCNKRPKSMHFEDMNLNRFDGEYISKPLKTVEELVFQNCDLDDFYINILRRCENIKRLTVKKCNIASQEEDTSWLNQQYPKLESLKIHLSAALDMMVLDDFLRYNSQIKKFAYICRLSKYPTRIENILVAIRHLQLEELFLTFAVVCNFQNIYLWLLDILKQKQFKRLDLEFGSCLVKDILIDNLNSLAQLDKLYALHINDIDIGKDLPNNIDTLTNLKELYLKHTPNTAYAAKKLASITPNLELLVIRDSVYFTPSFTDFVKPFIELLPKLKKIVLSYDVYSGFKQQINVLNEKRQKLSEPCIVHIWLPLQNPLKEQPTIVGKALIRIHAMIDVYEHY